MCVRSIMKQIFVVSVRDKPMKMAKNVDGFSATHIEHGGGVGVPQLTEVQMGAIPSLPM